MTTKKPMFILRNVAINRCKAVNIPIFMCTAYNCVGTGRRVLIISILGDIAVNEDGYKEIFCATGVTKEDKASWVEFYKWLKRPGLEGVKLIVGKL